MNAYEAGQADIADGFDSKTLCKPNMRESGDTQARGHRSVGLLYIQGEPLEQKRRNLSDVVV